MKPKLLFLILSLICVELAAARSVIASELGDSTRDIRAKNIFVSQRQSQEGEAKILTDDAKKNIDSARKAAQAAEENKSPRASQDYFDLAQAEANAQSAELAVKDAQHGLILFRRTDDSMGFYNGMLSSYNGLIFSSRLANSLAKAGRVKEGEAFINGAIRVTAERFGANGCASANEVCQMFVFYVDQKKDVEALNVLERLLRFNLRVVEVGQPSPLKQIYECTADLNRGGRSEFALVILERLLDTQKKWFDTDDARIADTLVKIAEIQDSINQNEHAEKNFLAAATIYRFYYGPLEVLRTRNLKRLAYGLIPLWQKMGKTTDAVILNINSLLICPALLRRFGYAQLAEEIVKTGKVPDSFFDPSSPSSRRLTDGGAATKSDGANRMLELLDAYHRDCVDAPYGSLATISLDNLMDVSFEERDWKILADAATNRCKVYEHESDASAGRKFGCTLPRNNRLDYYSRAALAYVHLDKVDEAQKWLDRGVRNMPELTCYEYITIALQELDCDDRVLATKYAELSEPLFTENYQSVYPALAERVWNLLGHPERAAAINAKGKDFKKQSEDRCKNAQN